MGVDIEAKENMGNKQPDPMGMLMTAKKETSSLSSYSKKNVEKALVERKMEGTPIPDPMSMLLQANKETTVLDDEKTAKKVDLAWQETDKQVEESLKVALQVQSEEDTQCIMIAKQYEDDLAFAKLAQEEEERNAAKEEQSRKQQFTEDEQVARKMHEELVQKLHEAVTSGKQEDLNKLIEQGVDLSLVSNTGDALSAVHVAIQKGKKDMLKFLIAQKAPLDTKDAKGSTPLHLACEANRMDAVQALVEAGAKIEAQDDYGRTPVMAAAKAGHLAPIKFLVGKGVNLYHKDKEHKMALQIVPFLSRNTKSTLEEMCGWGLLAASAKGKEKEVRRLLDRGASLRLSDENYRTALHHAVANGHLNIVNLLIERKASVLMVDIRRQSPLHIAAEKNYRDITSALLAGGGAVLGAVDIDGKTAQDLALPGSQTAKVLHDESVRQDCSNK